MTNEERAELRRLCDAATPGPWQWDTDDDCEGNRIGPPLVYIDRIDEADDRDILCRFQDGILPEPSRERDGRGVKNAHFIAESRTAVPALLADLDAAGAENARLRDALAACVNAMSAWGAEEDGVPESGPIGKAYDHARFVLGWESVAVKDDTDGKNG